MKRSVCWLLIFAIVLIFILPAGAAQTADFADAADIRNDCAVQMLVDLELIVGDQSGNFRPNAPITRAETAKLIACLCTDTPEASGRNAFADTAGSWAKDYIAYCAAQGIVGGSGGYFRPQDDVTAQELAKMLLVVVGFAAQQYTGAGWAGRVNTDAAQNGLYHDFTGCYDAPITRDDACLLIYNAMQCPAVDGENPDGTARYVLDGLMNRKTYLEVRFDAVRYSGVLTGNECADLTQAGGTLAQGATKLEGHREFDVSSGLDLVGHQTAVYVRSGKILGAPAASVQERTLEIRDTSKLEKISAGNGFRLTAQTEYFKNYVPASASALQELPEGAVVQLLDHDGDGSVEVALILSGFESVVTDTDPLTLRGGRRAEPFSASDPPVSGESVTCIEVGGTLYALPVR